MRVPVYIPTNDRRVLRRVVLAKSSALPRDHTNHYRLRLGVQSGERFSAIGTEYAGANHRIADGGRFTLFDGERALAATDLVALEVSRAGSPVALDDALLELATTFRTQPTDRRVDADLAEFLSEAGALERETVYPLSGLYVPVTATGRTQDANTQTVSSSSYVNGAVSLVVQQPPGKTVGHVHAVASATTTAASAAVGTLFVTVGDGTTDYDEQASNTPDNANSRAISTSAALTIYTTTTLTLRLKKDGGGANMEVMRQTLTYTVDWS